MRRGFFSSDAAIASILVLAIMALVVFSFRANASNLDHKSQQAFLERAAIESADFLLKNCAGEGGIAKCGKTIKSHELDSAAQQLLQNEAAKLSQSFGAKISVSLQPLGAQAAGGGVCIKRLALLEGKEMVLAVCAQ